MTGATLTKAGKTSPLRMPRRRSRAVKKVAWLGTKLAQLVIVVVVLTAIIAVLVRLIPGDPASAILGLNATPESLAALRTQLGLDQPLVTQILTQLRGVFTGDLGISTSRNLPVITVIMNALPVTLLLILLSTVMALLVSIPLGLIEAFGAGRHVVRCVRIVMVVLIALPSFLVGLYLILVFGVQLRIAPAGGWSTAWPDALRYAWLPAVAMATFLIPILTRSIMSSTSTLLREEFIEAAFSRGLSRSRIVLRHVLPNVLLPVITLVGFSVSVSLGAAVIIESVYGIPGFGGVVTRAVSERDYPLVVGVALFSGVFVIVVNMISELLYAVADPRSRTS